MLKPAQLLAISLVAAGSLQAGEYAIFASGFRMHIDRHETAPDVVRLFAGDGVTEVPAGLVTSFEPDDRNPAAILASQPDAPAVPVASPAPDPKILVRMAALKSGLPPALVESVATVESGIRQNVVSPKGAVGVMQLMPATARSLNADPKDVVQNIEAGARLLRELLLKFNGDVVKALSAYNAGLAAVERFHGMPPYAETENYVDRVIRLYLLKGGK